MSWSFSPCRYTRASQQRCYLWSNFVRANSIQDSQLGLAYQVHNSATRGCLMGPRYLELAGWLLDKPLTLAHSLNCCPLLVHLCRPTAAVTNHLQALGWADFIQDNGLELAHQAHNDATWGFHMGPCSLKLAGWLPSSFLHCPTFMKLLPLADTLEPACRGVIYKQFCVGPCTGKFHSRQFAQIGPLSA